MRESILAVASPGMLKGFFNRFGPLTGFRILATLDSAGPLDSMRISKGMPNNGQRGKRERQR